VAGRGGGSGGRGRGRGRRTGTHGDLSGKVLEQWERGGKDELKIRHHICPQRCALQHQPHKQKRKEGKNKGKEEEEEEEVVVVEGVEEEE